MLRIKSISIKKIGAKGFLRTLLRGWLGLGLIGILVNCSPVVPLRGLSTETLPPAPSPSTPSHTPSQTTFRVIPSPTRPTPTPCGAARLESHTIEPTPIGKPLRFQVYLPPCYNPQATPGYPVLYLLHGQGSDETLWLALGLTETLDRLVQAHQVKPFLVVMPHEEYALRNPQESAFGQTLIEVLVPWIETHFSVCRERGCRALGGISRGAGWALHLGIQHGDQFIAIGAHSPAPFWGDDLRLYYRAAELPADQWPRFYLDSGDRDRYLQAVLAFVDRLSNLGLPYEWHLNAGEHDVAYWRVHLEDYLRWYAAQWQIPSP